MHTATRPRRDQAHRVAAGPAFLRNRRHHARVDARGVAGHIHTRDASAPGLAVENISMGGLFVRSAAVLDVGTAVMVQVVRPGLKRAIELTGRIASVVTPAEAAARGLVAGMGIHIDPADEDTERRLRTLVDDLAAAAAVRQEPAPVVEAPAPANDGAAAELAATRARNEAQARRIAQLEAEVVHLRQEVLRRNRTVGDLANRLAAFERIRAAS